MNGADDRLFDMLHLVIDALHPVEIEPVAFADAGRCARRCQQALAPLAEAGISVELIDLRTVSPWDKEAVLASVAKTGRAVIAHEAVRHFGPGGEIASTISEELFGHLKAPVRRLGAPYSPVPFAKVLEDAYIVSPDQVVETVKALMV